VAGEAREGEERIKEERMEKEEAVKVFALVVREHMLPATMDKLVPLSFIGAAAVKFYQAKVKLMNQLGITEAQRKVTLSDGQDAGEMLLNIEARIGELLPSAEEALRLGGQKPGTPKGGGGSKVLPPDMKSKQAQAARAIHRNPAAVKAVIKQARENEDIPTKTAVLNKIKADRTARELNTLRDRFPREEKPLLAEYLEKCIDHVIQVNSVVKRFFDHPDQVSAERMTYFVKQVKALVEIISESTGRTGWKQLS
jgi:hypothetical protein